MFIIIVPLCWILSSCNCIYKFGPYHRKAWLSIKIWPTKHTLKFYFGVCVLNEKKDNSWSLKIVEFIKPGLNSHWRNQTKENRIYIRGEFTRKKCETVILLYCFHTAGVLHIFVLNLLGPGTSFFRKSKISIKKTNYEIGRFHNWPMIISHRLYAFHFTNDDFPL